MVFDEIYLALSATGSLQIERSGSLVSHYLTPTAYIAINGYSNSYMQWHQVVRMLTCNLCKFYKTGGILNSFTCRNSKGILGQERPGSDSSSLQYDELEVTMIVDHNSLTSASLLELDMEGKGTVVHLPRRAEHTGLPRSGRCIKRKSPA
ncbi:hypothetical protein ASPFODRAFT_351104 [Aspergillus luchuensis CBS 106.47]|uniref:Uncharacterized protein n=1 Tax=Aspergillus luchuensis (strain CBS 106.47) TaxID=1137211 RepID=A0A1M3T6A7_ASPLC|nr:hypothetical protein ASPFODRAFT_351104 [Aspergillus luchuensis CBS 106.47]